MRIDAQLGDDVKQIATCLMLGTLLIVQVPFQTASGSRHFTLGEEPMSLPAHRFLHAETGHDVSENADASAYATFILSTVQRSLPEKHQGEARRVARALIDEANARGFDPLLLVAVVRQESRFNPEARGRHGEIGLMQIKPSTARWLAHKAKMNPLSDAQIERLLLSPVTNIQIGAAYLAHLKGSFKGSSQLYVSAYNMGPGNLRLRLKESIQPRIYADKVFEKYHALTSELLMASHAAEGQRQLALSSLAEDEVVDF